MESDTAASANKPSITSRPRTVPIGDYGFLSDGETTALVAPGGSVDWMCLPRMDSPSIFGALLGQHAGSFRVAPSDITVPVARRYLPGTMVLETSWATTTGWMVVHDALIIGPWRHDDKRSTTQRRTPTDYEAEHTLLRTIRCVKGEVQTVVECEPVPDYGRSTVRWDYTDHVYRQGQARTDELAQTLTLTTDLRLGFEGGRAGARTLLKEGETRYV
ncbi:MAG: trehalase-like domain-containing protein, partial [Sciscionella sp.]